MFKLLFNWFKASFLLAIILTFVQDINGTIHIFIAFGVAMLISALLGIFRFFIRKKPLVHKFDRVRRLTEYYGAIVAIGWHLGSQIVVLNFSFSLFGLIAGVVLCVYFHKNKKFHD